jgi:hypothetical protein
LKAFLYSDFYFCNHTSEEAPKDIHTSMPPHSPTISSEAKTQSPLKDPVESAKLAKTEKSPEGSQRKNGPRRVTPSRHYFQDASSSSSCWWCKFPMFSCRLWFLSFLLSDSSFDLSISCAANCHGIHGIGQSMHWVPHQC